MCKDLNLKALLSWSINTYTYAFFLFLLRQNRSLGYSHVDLLFTDEEQKKVGSWQIL